MKTKNEKAIKRQLVFLALLQIVMIMLALPGAGYSASVMLDWDPSSDADLAGYKVHYQANSPLSGTAAEGSVPVDVANALTTTIDGLDPGNSYYFAVTAYNTAGQESVYSNVIEIPESVPPVVAISSPSNNASVSGAVTISTNASDNVAVASVQFYLNGVLQATQTAAPYAFIWDTSSLPGGVYTITAKALDAAGNVGQSGDVAVTVTGDTVSPTVSLIAPGNNASVSGTVTVTASASDNVAVSKIEIYDNGTLTLASNQSPASYSWNSLLAANGNHTLNAKAYDAAGNVGVTSLTVSVDNQIAADTTAPVITSMSPAGGSKIAGNVTVSASATDNVAVTRMQLYVDNVLQLTTSQGSFSWTLSARNYSKGSAHVILVKAYDAANNVNSQSVTVYK